MNTKLFLGATFLGLSAVGAWSLQDKPGRWLDTGYHHLGNDVVKDWPEADPKPEAKRLDVEFESLANAGEWTLFLEQRSIDNAWRMQLNGVEFALMKAWPALAERSYAIPAGAVQAGKNVLSFVPDQPNDDVVIGKLRLVEQSLRQMFDTQPVQLLVRDAADASALPARVSFVDAAGAPVEIYYAESPRSAVRAGVIYVGDGEVALELPPGEYTSYATRGFEWSSSKVALKLERGVPARVEHTLRRELDTQGFLAADTHLHTLQFSGHGDSSALERQVTLAGEGVEFAVATDHNHQTDYAPFQAQAGLSRFYTTVVGNEVTTEVGHFNGFPLPAKGPLPAHELRDYVAIVDDIRAKGAQVVVLNHPRWPSYEDSPFTNEKLDLATGAFASGLRLTVDATEMINATTEQQDPLRLFRDWFALLNRGVRIFAVGTSDSHTVGDPVGQGRTYFVSASDDPANIDVAAACEAIKNGRSSIGMGIFASVVVEGSARMGDTLEVPRAAGAPAPVVKLRLRVQAPSWIVARKATLFVNGKAQAEREIPSVRGRLDQQLDFELRCETSYDRYVVCVVTGDPARGPFWPSLNPYSLAATNPVFLDVDGGGWSSPRETAALLLERAPPQGEGLAELVAACDDEAIVVHLLDQLALRLRQAGSSPQELRQRILDLAARADPRLEGVQRFCERF